MSLYEFRLAEKRGEQGAREGRFAQSITGRAWNKLGRGAVWEDGTLSMKSELEVDFDPSFSQLSDLMHVTVMNITGAEMQELVASTAFSSRSRRAVLASNDLAFGLARMFEQIREAKGDLGIRVLRKLEDALDWIVNKDGSA